MESKVVYTIAPTNPLYAKMIGAVTGDKEFGEIRNHLNANPCKGRVTLSEKSGVEFTLEGAMKELSSWVERLERLTGDRIDHQQGLLRPRFGKTVTVRKSTY